MANEENKDEVRKSAREILSRVEGDGRINSFTERKEVIEKEISPEEKIIREEIRRELDLMDQDNNLKKESENKAKQIQALGEEDKIENLLKLAKEKGVIYAIKVANNMNDPYVLDIFHDVLVREGLWRRFEK